MLRFVFLRLSARRRCLHRVLRARAPMMRALVMYARCMTQPHAQVNNIAPNYSPEVETEKPFKRKRKENDLEGKVLCVFWWDRHCRVTHRQNRVVRKFAHAHIAILASSYSDDVIAFEVKKIEKSLSDFSNFLRWNSLRFGREVIPY